jgi:hypothetical protein
MICKCFAIECLDWSHAGYALAVAVVVGVLLIKGWIK